MESKLEKLIHSAVRLGCLKCPVCGESLAFSGGGFTCIRGHMYNPNKRGFINFLSSPAESCYDERLFIARSHVFESGLYTPVLNKIVRMTGNKKRILDVGCGEGWYLCSLLEMLPDALGCGIDISRDAITKAACRTPSALWCVADLMRMPFMDNSFDAVLDILTPANYSEFARVLAPDGVLIKVYPGENYLREIREMRHLPLYAEGSVEQYMREHAEILAMSRVNVTSPISPETWRNLVWMTPLNQNMSDHEKEALAAVPSPVITIDLHVAKCVFSHS